MKKIQLSAFGKEFLVVKFTTASMLYFWEFLLNLSYIRKQKLFYFTQVFKFLGRYLFIVIAYNLLYFCGISCNLSSFFSNCVYLNLLFFLMSLLKGLLILFIFSKNQLLDSLILWIVLLVSMSFNSALILVISFLVLALGCLRCCSSFLWV